MSQDITRKTKIGIGMLTIVVTIAVAWGALWTKVDYIQQEITEIKTEIAAIHDKFFNQIALNP